MSYDKENVHIKARIPRKEYEQLKKQVKKKGLSVAEYIRLKLFGRKPIVPLGEPVEDE